MRKMSKYCACKSPVCGPACRSRELADQQFSYNSLKSEGIDHSCCGKGYCGIQGAGDCGIYQRRKKTIPDKLIFIIEWYENGSDLKKKYMLTYYGLDGTCEVKDLINNQRFLRRLKLDTVNLSQLYLGNVINIYGRPMTLIEYADTCTRNYLEEKTQRAFLMVKPHAIQHLGKIVRVLELNFKILRARMASFSVEAANKFYEHLKADTTFVALVGQITSGPTIGFLLIGENAISKLNALVGDPDPGKAKLSNPNSLRAMIGSDPVLNGVYTSDAPNNVEQDAALYFTECREDLRRLSAGNTALFKCATCCIIKPNAVKNGLVGCIMEYILKAGYKITALELFYLDRTHADEFYEIYKGVLDEYSDMTAELSKGPSYVLEISGFGENTVESFREFCGPKDPILAKKLRPASLRAIYGTSLVHNAVHCTDLCEDAEMELEYFFKILQMV